MAKTSAVKVAIIGSAGVILAALVTAVFGLIKPDAKPAVVVVPPVPNVKVVAELHEETPASDIETLRDVSMWDLRGWKQLTEANQDPRVSPANYVNYLHVKKIKAAKVYRAHYSTDGSLIDIRCITHAASILQATASSKDPKSKEYEVEVNVEDVEVGKEFLIVIEATYWNSFQNMTQETVSTYTDEDMKEMDELAVFILLPEEKPFKDVQLMEEQTGSGNLTEYRGTERLYRDASGKFIYWSVVDRKPDHHYRILWSW